MIVVDAGVLAGALGADTLYDAAYVALAEALEVTLLTTARRLSRAPGVRCVVDVLR